VGGKRWSGRGGGGREGDGGTGQGKETESGEWANSGGWGEGRMEPSVTRNEKQYVMAEERTGK